MNTHHTIVLDTAKESRQYYGIRYTSRNVYGQDKRFGGHTPTRLDVWDNTGRPNPDLGKQLGATLRNGNTLTEWGAGQGYADRKYISPNGDPTDEPITILLSPECSVITSNGTNTGTEASGQVFGKGLLADGDSATLVYPSGKTREVILHLPPRNNDHGYAKFAD